MGFCLLILVKSPANELNLFFLQGSYFNIFHVGFVVRNQCNCTW